MSQGDFAAAPIKVRRKTTALMTSGPFHGTLKPDEVVTFLIGFCLNHRRIREPQKHPKSTGESVSWRIHHRNPAYR